MSAPIVHRCHATGCATPVKPKMWGCRRHWFMVPRVLRAEVWRHYRHGQEIDKMPSDEYIAASRAAVAAVAAEVAS